MTCLQPDCAGTIADGYCGTCGVAPRRSEPPPPTARGPRLLAGLVPAPPLPPNEPLSALLKTPRVAEQHRHCSGCGQAVGRRHAGAAGRTKGYCGACGRPFSFEPQLKAGELVNEQYDIAGCIAHGGQGWIYLARDVKVGGSWVVLKGLVNSGDERATSELETEMLRLVEAKHENVVRILNVTVWRGSRYLVMEYLSGMSLQAKLPARGAPAPDGESRLPVQQAIGYIHDILPALEHLHGLRLLFCDFKPDNVIDSHAGMKLVDLGGVHRMDDESRASFSTPGFHAREIAAGGPTIPSDLYTVGRTLAALCVDLTRSPWSLPDPADTPLFRHYDSLYRFLLRGTDDDPKARFQSAEEMRVQLHGVLREIVSEQQNAPEPETSTLFTEKQRGSTSRPDWRRLPLLRGAPQDPAALRLRLALTLIEGGRHAEAAAELDALGSADPRDWRVTWMRGVAALAQADLTAAERHFTAVYRLIPGELAPKLALGLTREYAGDTTAAEAWYAIVSRTDPAYAAATFGLARCLQARGDQPGAVAVLGRVVDTSRRAFDDAQAATAECLLSLGDLDGAGRAVERLPDDERRERLTADVLRAVLQSLKDGTASPDPDRRLLTHPVTEAGTGAGLASTLRSLARRAKTPAARIRLIDEANRVRPTTWF